ncbi:hypothetical protein NQ314_005289 [Rhamnusium bicolor]|uniref:Uncharacterized protein n=1 Tax=Rhamnusium bicolor TaxID=1586634 RepID=A0AAV8ZHE7_9CUCU|nr:hypothetical protein NQ314_005289 [Rhamnusium bicolor]
MLLQKNLLGKGVNILDTFLNKTPNNENNEILGSVAVQIGIIDTLQLLEIKPRDSLGYSFGVLVAAYYNGHITLEETINCAFVINKFLNDVNKLCNTKKQNIIQVRYAN